MTNTTAISNTSSFTVKHLFASVSAMSNNVSDTSEKVKDTSETLKGLITALLYSSEIPPVTTLSVSEMSEKVSGVFEIVSELSENISESSKIIQETQKIKPVTSDN